MSTPIDLADGPWSPDAGEDFDLQVEVRQHHIVLGRPSDCARCPIALAIAAACQARNLDLDHATPVKVYGDHCALTLRDGRWYTANLPHAARKLIVAFDHGHVDDVSLISFTLRMEHVRPGEEMYR